MTLAKRRSTNEYFVTCDGCGELLQLDTKDFKEAVTLYSDEGWIFLREGGEAHHYCPDCKEKLDDYLQG